MRRPGRFGKEWPRGPTGRFGKEWPRGPGGRFGPPTFATESDPIETGFVFINGQYVPSPYTVSRTEDQALVNGAPVVSAEQSSWGEGPRRPPQQAEIRWFGSFRSIVSTLREGGIVVVFDGTPAASLPITDLGGDLLRAITSKDRESALPIDFLERLPLGTDVEQWRVWVESYDPPADLVERAKSAIEEIDSIERENLRQNAAVRRLDSLLYGLTVTAMVVAVVALGHLLTFRPPMNARWRDVDSSTQSTRMVVRLVVLVVLMSGFDLAWTLLSSDNGHFRELNPLGSHLLANATFLTAFKTIAILGSAALLFALRRFRGAQMASWWLCLVCTVVTFRWLMYDSMFLS